MREALVILAEAVEAGEVRCFKTSRLASGTTSNPALRFCVTADAVEKTALYVPCWGETVGEALALMADQVANMSERAA